VKEIKLEIEEYCWLQALLSDIKSKTPDIGGMVTKHYGTFGQEALTRIYDKHFSER